MHRLLAIFAILGALALTAGPADAGELSSGGYSIHYSALSSNVLPAAVTARLGVQPSASGGVVNVTVLKDGDNVPATRVSGSARTLTGMKLPIRFQRITDASGESWLGTFTIPGTDTLRFDLEVTTADGKVHPVAFSHDYVIR